MAEGKSGRKSKSEAEDQAKAGRNAARVEEAERLGFIVSVRFSPIEMKRLKDHANGAKRSMSYIIREHLEDVIAE